MNTDLWVIFYAHVFVNGVVMIDKCCLMFPAGGFSIPENELFLHVWLSIYCCIRLPSVLWRCWLGGRKGIRPVENWVVGCCMVICLERGADLHVAQLMPLPLTVSCFSKIQIGFTFLVPAHPGSPGKRAIKRGCYCCIRLWRCIFESFLLPCSGEMHCCMVIATGIDWLRYFVNYI